jgi:VCBS repeat-containing protein
VVLKIRTATVGSIADDTGSSSTDFMTLDNTLALSGQVTTSGNGRGTLDVFLVGGAFGTGNGTLVGTTTITGNGSWTYDLATSSNLAARTLADGTYTIRLADDLAPSRTIATHNFTIDTHAPTITSGHTGSEAENTAQSHVVYTAIATDAHTVAFSLTGADANQFNINSSTGAVTFKVSPNFEAPTDTGADNTYNFTINATDLAGNVSTSGVAITVTNVNELPAPIADAVAVNEDATALTTIRAAGVLGNDTDPDAGDTANLVVSTVLAGTNGPASSLSGGVATVNGSFGALTIHSDGTYTYSPNNSSAEALAQGAAAQDVFTYTAQDTTGATTTTTLTFNITGVNDPAVIGTPIDHDVTEDSNISLDGNLTASGRLTISDVDGPASFQAGATGAASNLGSLTFGTDGTYTYSVANSATQYLSATDTKIDTFTITSLDGTSRDINFSIHGSQDAPNLVLGAATATGTSDANIPLSIGATLIDTSSTLSVEVDGVPSSYLLSHGIALDDGRWLVSGADLSTLALVPGNGATSGNFNLHVTAISDDGLHQAVSSGQDIAVTVTPGANEHGGRLVDGYIAGATVFADANGNGLFDPTEAHTTTNADGSFTLVGGSGPLISTGGTDVSTGLAFTGVLRAPSGSTVITPLTTLISALLPTNPSQAQIDAASDQVAAALGFSSAIDLQTFDPVPGAISGDPIALAVLSAAIQVESTVVQIAAASDDPILGTSAGVFAAIATAITTTPATFDLTQTSTLTTIATNSGVTAAETTAVADIVSSTNTVIDSSTSVTTLAQAADVAQGTTATALAGPTDPNSLVTTYSTTNVQTLASSAPVGDVNGAQLGTLGNDNLTGDNTSNSIDGLDGNDQISGGAGNDFLYGGAGNDHLTGGAGDDYLDGGQGRDYAVYTDAGPGGVTVRLGTVNNLAGGTVTGDGIGTDTLINIEFVVGSDFADHYDSSGFNGTMGIPGVQIGFNEFEGRGGDDIIVGDVNRSGQESTRVSYLSAAAGVTVDLATGTGQGTAANDIAQVGTDHFTFVNAITGSAYADILRGSDNPFGTYEQFDGRGGNDLIDGRGGYDLLVYNLDAATTSGISVNLAAGIVTGDASVGTDTLRAVEAVRGTNFADTYDATGFSDTSTNAGSSGTFNNFDGEGGNDTIIGNGNTRIQYSQSLAGVTVDMAAGSAHGTAAGDIANVGTDTFSGVNSVMGSMFDDILSGDNLNNAFQGLAGNDTINGRGGFDTASYYNLTYTTGAITVDMASGIVTGDASSGTDTLRSIEGVQGTFFDDTYVATGMGTGANIGNFGTFSQFEGMDGNDHITGNGNTRVVYANASAAVTVDLAGTAHGTAPGDLAHVGNDTFTLVNSVAGSAFDDHFIGTANSETFLGLGGNDLIDAGAGFDTAVYNGFSMTGGISVDLAAGTVIGNASIGTDTLHSVEGVQGTNSADTYVATGYGSGGALNIGNFTAFNQFEGLGGNDTITGNGSTRILYNNATSAVTVDLAAGTAHGTLGGDVANVGTDTIAGGVNSVQGSSFGDTISGSSGNDVIIGNGGADLLRGGAGSDTFTYNAASESTVAAHDTISDFTHGQDQIDFTGIAGITASGGVPTFQGDITGSLILNAHSVAYIEVGGNTVVLANTTASNETVTTADFSAANMEIILTGVSLGLTASDFHHF